MIAVAVWFVPSIIVAFLASVVAVGKSVLWLYRWANRLEDSMRYVEAEMRHNGGATLRDSMARTEELIASQVDAASAERVHVRDRLDRIDRQIEGLA